MYAHQKWFLKRGCVGGPWFPYFRIVFCSLEIETKWKKLTLVSVYFVEYHHLFLSLLVLQNCGMNTLLIKSVMSIVYGRFREIMYEENIGWWDGEN